MVLPQRQQLDHQRPVVPVRLAELGRPGDPRAIQLLAQRAVVGVVDDRRVARVLQRDLVAGAAFGGCRLGEHLDRVVRHARQRLRIVDIERERVDRVEHVLGVARRHLRLPLDERLEARLAVGRQLGASESEVPQLVLDHPAPRRGPRREVRQRGEFLEARVKRLVLRQFGEERRQLRLVGVVLLAQLRRVDHRVQVRHSAPGPSEPVGDVVERIHDGVP
jgi:hypothetical protein